MISRDTTLCDSKCSVFNNNKNITKLSKKQESRPILWGQPALTPRGCTILWGKKKNKKVWSIPEEINNIVPEEAQILNILNQGFK